MHKKLIIALLIAGVALAWGVFGITLAVGAERQTKIVMLTVAALASELALWGGAAVMGMAAYEARAKILSRIHTLISGHSKAS